MKLPTLQTKYAEAEAQLARHKERCVALANRVTAGRIKQAKRLPAMFGVNNIDEVVLALAPQCSRELAAKLNGAHVASAPKVTGREVGPKMFEQPPPRGTRYGDDMKARVKQALLAGGKTAAQIAGEFGVPETTIKGWKQDWRLTRKYKLAKKVPKAKRAK